MVNIQDGYAKMQLSYQNLDKSYEIIGSLANELETSVGEFKIV